MGRLVLSVEQPQSSFQLFLFGHEPRGENVVDDRVESPQLFDRHALERLPFHESPDSRIPPELGLKGASRQLVVG